MRCSSCCAIVREARVGAGYQAERPKTVGSWQRQLHEPSGIEVDALPAHCNMEMRSGSSPGASAHPDFLTAFDRFSFFHFEFGKMEIESKQSLAVIDRD